MGFHQRVAVRALRRPPVDLSRTCGSPAGGGVDVATAGLRDYDTADTREEDPPLGRRTSGMDR